MMKAKIKYLLLLTIILLAISCKNKQHNIIAVPPEIDTNVTTTIIDTPQNVPANIYTLSYQWYSSRMSINVSNLQQNKSIISLSVFFVNKRDSAIFINISKLGIEGARIVLTPDSVKYNNHLNQEYYWGDYSIIKKIFGFDIDFYCIQALLLAEDLPHYEPSFTKNNINNEIVYYNQLRKNNINNTLLEEKIVTDTNSFIKEHNIKEISTLSSINLRYGNYTNISNQFCYQTLIITIPTIQLILEANLKDTKLNIMGPLAIRFPNKYTPIKLE